MQENAGNDPRPIEIAVMTSKDSYARSTEAQAKQFHDFDEGSKGETRRLISAVVDVSSTVKGDGVVQTPLMSIALVMDRSSSMKTECGSNGALTRLSMLQEAACWFIDSADRKPDDLIALVSFDKRPTTIHPPARVADAKLSLQHAVREMVPGRGTRIREAMVSAAELLNNSTSTGQYRHKLMVVLTDGEDWGAGHAVVQRQAAFEGIEVAMVAISPAADVSECQFIADNLNGQMIPVTDTDGIAASIGALDGLDRVATNTFMNLRPCPGGSISLISQGFHFSRTYPDDGWKVMFGAISPDTPKRLLLDVKVPITYEGPAIMCEFNGTDCNGKPIVIKAEVPFRWSPGDKDGTENSTVAEEVMKQKISKAIKTGTKVAIAEMITVLENHPLKSSLESELELMRQLKRDFEERDKEEVQMLCHKFSVDTATASYSFCPDTRYDDIYRERSMPKSKSYRRAREYRKRGERFKQAATPLLK